MAHPALKDLPSLLLTCHPSLLNSNLLPLWSLFHLKTTGDPEDVSCAGEGEEVERTEILSGGPPGGRAAAPLFSVRFRSALPLLTSVPGAPSLEVRVTL